MIRSLSTLALATGVCLSLALPAAAQDKAEVEKGAALFTSKTCVMCHSVGTKGNKKGPLDEVATKLKVEEIREWLTNPDEMRVEDEGDARAGDEAAPPQQGSGRRARRVPAGAEGLHRKRAEVAPEIRHDTD